MNKLDDIKQALVRKIGPLPAWAWAIILFGVVYYVRRRNAANANTADTTTGQVVDSTATPGSPVTLGPGESVYDPSTGQLTASAPGQLPVDPQSPITLEPGEAAFDPNTGQLVTNEPPPDNASTKPTPTATKAKTRGPSTRHLLAELAHPSRYSASHLAHVRRLLQSRHVKIPRRKNKTPKRQTHPANARGHKHKPQHSTLPKKHPVQTRSHAVIRPTRPVKVGPTPHPTVRYRRRRK